MKFVIHSPKYYRYADMINKYPILSEYGIIPYSKYKNWGEIELSTLDDLLNLIKQLQIEVVMGDYSTYKKVKIPQIIIYDDFLE